MRSRSAARIDGRADLLVRVHVLRGLRDARARWPLPELRRRTCAAAAAPGRKARRRARLDPAGRPARRLRAGGVTRAGRPAPPALEGLPPIENPRARVLILGSMPGAASLAAGQYYAHPQNLFWPLLGALLGFDPRADYVLRVAALKRAGIALWDVIGRCRRSGSLDARIDPQSVVANDFAGFLDRHPRLHTVCFNGATAEANWRRHVQPTLGARELPALRLPSTSPANASIPHARKLAAWAAALAGTTCASTLLPAGQADGDAGS